ncbi:MAG: hypothetical protein L7U72_14975 [Rubripirellula sp.]|nr:hypothetical protein [Rubripirellula sp.]
MFQQLHLTNAIVSLGYRNAPFAVLLALLGTLFAPASSSIADEKSGDTTQSTLTVHKVTDKVSYGEKPDTLADWNHLHQLGYKTIISVDAVAPDKKTAETLSMHVIHLPLGYARIPTNRVLDLAKSTQSSSAKVYIHCHHGKYRAPIAAVVACIADGSLLREDSGAILANTNCQEKYEDLFQSAVTVRPISKERLRFHRFQTEKQQPESPTVIWMSELAKPADRFFSATRNAQTFANTNREALDQDSRLIRQALSELSRAHQRKDIDYQDHLNTALSLAQAIDSLLTSPVNTEDFERVLLDRSAALHQCCVECHRKHR